MRISHALIAAALGAVSATASMATDTTIGFTSGTSVIFGSRTAPATNQSDTFTFATNGADFFSGSITTRRLVNPADTSQVFTDMNFLGATLFNVTTGTLLRTFAAPGAANEETINLLSTQLNGGDIYTLTVNYDVIVADPNNAASYAGPLYLASVSEAPEPASWAMMVGGFGLVGAGMRRGSRKLATAQA